MEHPNAALMRRAGELLNVGDFEGFLALHTDDVVMHVPGDSPLAGDHKGREGVAAVFRKELSMLDGPPEFMLHDDIGSDEHAVALVTQTLSRNGRTLQARQTIVAHVRHGMFSEVWLQPRTRPRSTGSSHDDGSVGEEDARCMAVGVLLLGVAPPR